MPKVRRWKVLNDLIDEYNVKSVLEIGVLKAENAQNILLEHPELIYIGVDPYIPFDDQPDYDHCNNQVLAERVFEQYRFADLLVMTSRDAAGALNGTPIDLVFIDGDHSYEAVKDDIMLWRDNCKILAGHDYSPHHSGVVRAVNEMIGEKNITVTYDNVWWTNYARSE